jgi:ribosome-associated protein
MAASIDTKYAKYTKYRGRAMVTINERISIPEDELQFTASRSGGPGGQHVNKVSSKVILWFDLAKSPSLSPEDKELIASRLGSRIDKDGVLRVVSQSTRSQLSNRELAIERFVELLQAALKQLPVRKKTRVSMGAKLRRLEEKKQRAIQKQARSKKVPIED